MLDADLSECLEEIIKRCHDGTTGDGKLDAKTANQYITDVMRVASALTCYSANIVLEASEKSTRDDVVQTFLDNFKGLLEEQVYAGRMVGGKSNVLSIKDFIKGGVDNGL